MKTTTVTAVAMSVITVPVMTTLPTAPVVGMTIMNGAATVTTMTMRVIAMVTVMEMMWSSIKLDNMLIVFSMITTTRQNLESFWDAGSKIGGLLLK